MKQIHLLQAHLCKVAFFLSLLVVLFLLLSFIFMTPENIKLANLVQKVNTFFSWPYNMLEQLTRVSMSWVLTALCILVFWFLVFYLIMLSFTRFKRG